MSQVTAADGGSAPGKDFDSWYVCGKSDSYKGCNRNFYEEFPKWSEEFYQRYINGCLDGTKEFDDECSFLTPNSMALQSLQARAFPHCVASR